MLTLASRISRTCVRHGSLLYVSIYCKCEACLFYITNGVVIGTCRAEILGFNYFYSRNISILKSEPELKHNIYTYTVVGIFFKSNVFVCQPEY